MVCLAPLGRPYKGRYDQSATVPIRPGLVPDDAQVAGLARLEGQLAEARFEGLALAEVPGPEFVPDARHQPDDGELAPRARDDAGRGVGPGGTQQVGPVRDRGDDGQGIGSGRGKRVRKGDGAN